VQGGGNVAGSAGAAIGNQVGQGLLGDQAGKGVGTAGDKHNIAFAFSHLRMDPLPHAVVGGDEGLAGKPEPAIFLEAARRLARQRFFHRVSLCLR
jgi:beta-phosphoglucomutase-like phosphatase (HAD superfamily)